MCGSFLCKERKWIQSLTSKRATLISWQCFCPIFFWFSKEFLRKSGQQIHPPEIMPLETCYQTWPFCYLSVSLSFDNRFHCFPSLWIRGKIVVFCDHFVQIYPWSYLIHAPRSPIILSPSGRVNISVRMFILSL